jgi:spore maturation protein CgeB
MKILYMYEDYMGRRERYGKEMQRLGHKVVFFRANKNSRNALKDKDVKKHNTDLIWLLNPFYARMNKPGLQYARDRKIPIVLYGTLNPRKPYMNWLDYWRIFDFLFVHNLELCDYLKSQGLNSHFMPIGFYPDMYFRDISPHKKLDVSFCGGMLPEMPCKRDKRCSFLRSLQELDLRVKVYGESFAGKLGNIPVTPYRKHDKQRSVYAKTKVNLDMPFYSRFHPFYLDKYHIKNRFFEIPATGNFMLALRYPESEMIYTEDHVGFYDPTIESFHEQIMRYLKDEKVRKEKAARAYELVHQKHTFAHRFIEMFKILDSSI